MKELCLALQDDWSVLHEINLPSSRFRPFHQHHPAENTSHHVIRLVVLLHLRDLMHVSGQTLCLWVSLSPAHITLITAAGTVVTDRPLQEELHELDPRQADSRSDGSEILQSYDILPSVIYVYRYLPFAFSD